MSLQPRFLLLLFLLAGTFSCGRREPAPKAPRAAATTPPRPAAAEVAAPPGRAAVDGPDDPGGEPAAAPTPGETAPAAASIRVFADLEEATNALTQLEVDMAEAHLDTTRDAAAANVETALRRARFFTEYYRPTPTMLRELTRAVAGARSALTAARATDARFIAGELEEGYYSANDNSFQPFLRFLPLPAADGQPLPLIVFLHGYSPYLNIANWAAFPEKLVEFAARNGYALVAPFGRSNTDFQGIGEQDVMRVIAEMESRYAIDPDRIILFGHSMGGMGVWTLGAHYPDRFAGLIVSAGRGDYYHWQMVERAAMPAYKRVLIDTEYAAPDLLPNLLGLPILCAHSRDDAVVPYAEGRHMAELCAGKGLAITRLDLDGLGHYINDELFGRADVQDWIKARRRAPREEFDYVTYHERYDRCQWLRIGGLARGALPATIRVRRDGEALTVQTTGILALAIDRARMPEAIRDLPVHVTPDIVVTDPAPPGAAPSAARRAPCGPVKEAFLAPFLFVRCGKRADDTDMAGFRQATLDWTRFAKAPPRIALEDKVTPEDLARFNLFLFGDPADSLLMRKVLDRSKTLRVTAGAWQVGSHRYPRAGTGLFATQPSPWNPERLIVLQSGLAWGDNLPENHKFDFLPDYIVYTAETDPDGSNRALCAGFFDENGQVAEALMHRAPDAEIPDDPPPPPAEEDDPP